MQTYIPFKEYKKCAEILSNEDLLRQKDNAAELLYYILHKKNIVQISKKDLKKTYSKIEDNPIFKMWWNKENPYLKALYNYLDIMAFECFNRKIFFKKNEILVLKTLVGIHQHKFHQGRPITPKRITSGYRIILLCNNEKFYKSKFFVTYLKNKEIIQTLKQSQERFKFAKFLGLLTT